ncbi:MAG: restriction endonuclease [Clostridia bacterium]|nr:restriction endonuclease [Clostridia bacterium]
MPIANDDRFERNIDELEQHACKWWPKEVRDEAQRISILQTLLDTQERFISILKLTDKNRITSLFGLIDASLFPYTLFLKHLVVLTDFGGEPLQRINKNFQEIFPDGTLQYDVGAGTQEYRFVSLPVNGVLNNAKMKIDTEDNLQLQLENSSLQKDIIMILLFGGAAVNPSTRAILFKCTPYEYLGDEGKIEEFVRQNYIRVSRIISGKTASDLGNVAQQYVVTYLTDHLGTNYCVRSNGTIPGVTQNDGQTLTTVDVVVDRIDDTSRHKKYVAVEVTFQETSNSTIERKGGQARDRFEKITSSRNYIAYIIDGAGNFSRRSAVSVLCDNSHCNVAYTPEEFELLIEFIKEKIG